MRCRKCKGEVKVIKGYISSLTVKEDVIYKCKVCGYLDNIVLDYGVHDENRHK